MKEAREGSERCRSKTEAWRRREKNANERRNGGRKREEKRMPDGDM